VPGKRGPVGAATDADLVGHIRRVLAESPFVGEGYRKVWARLRHQGVRTAAERVRRLMREHHLQAPRRGGNAHGPKAHDGTITTETPDEMWGTDMTTTVTTGEGLAHVFVAVDHCTCECVGLHAAKGGNRFEALEPLRQGVREHFGRFEAKAAEGLTIRHDHGSNYLSDDFQRELRFLGMASSPSFVREPEGNGCAERFVRTLKEQLLWVRIFATVAELVEALREFRRTYNERWLIGRHGHRTPSQVRRDLIGSKSEAA
jgi:transposase InsO family protein